jgi:excisionase family DNA binding protein
MLIHAPYEPPKSATTPPLAAAAARLRRRPGRPRKHPQPVTFPVTLRTAKQNDPKNRHVARSEARSPVHQTSVPPRLLGVRAAGEYLGVSRFTIRNMLRDTRLRAVVVPGVNRVLVDRVELDLLIEGWKAS